jgi:PAS domain S-box-containing protein
MMACFPRVQRVTVSGSNGDAYMILSRYTALLLVLLGSLASDRLNAEPRRVLLLHSFGSDFAPFDSFASEFRTELAGLWPEPLDFFEASLASARFNEAAQDQPVVQYLNALFLDRELSLVVPIGGPAVRFVQKYRQQLFPGVPILIAATDERHVQSDALKPEDALVPVRNEPNRMIEHILQLLPQTTNLAIVIGNSPLEKFWLGQLQHDFQAFTNRVNLVWLDNLPFRETLKRCAALPPRSAIFFAIMYVDANGVPHLEKRALDDLHAAANAPIFALHSTHLGHGIVGGPLMQIEELSRKAASAAAHVLAGEPPASVRLPAQTPGTPTFDWRQLQRWGISESLLPTGSEVRFRQASVWELHRSRILGLLMVGLAETALLILLAVNLVRRRRAERSLRESEQRLGIATTAGDLGVWVWDMGRNSVWANSQWREMFGFPAEGPLDYQSVLHRIHPEDRPRVDQAVRRALADSANYDGEFRVVLPNGAQRWVVARGRVEIIGKPQSARMFGVTMDITGRKRTESAARDLTRRLIAAQEEERSRLARELHDDITQRLARLAIDVSHNESATDGNARAETAREVRDGLARLSEDVHSLSYRLHPAMLDDLGLSTALRAECERFSKRSPIRVSVAVDDVHESIPPQISLALFRVAQESLNNIARHSNAQNAQLSLRTVDGGLQLAVQDDGRGFDPAKHPDRPSLGLASMRERIELLGGEFDLESSPGCGVTILAWVPLVETMKLGAPQHDAA